MSPTAIGEGRVSPSLRSPARHALEAAGRLKRPVDDDVLDKQRRVTATHTPTAAPDVSRQLAPHDDLEHQAAAVDRLAHELHTARTVLRAPAPADEKGDSRQRGELSDDRLAGLLRLGGDDDGKKGSPDPSFKPGVISTSSDILSSSGLPLSSLSSSLVSSPPVSSPVESPPEEPPYIPDVSSSAGGGDGGGGGDPFMLDLNHDGRIGVTGTSTAQGRRDSVINPTVDFDIDGNGSTDHIEWSNGDGDGLLIDDRDGGATAAMNGSHTIDGTRLYGDEGGRFSNGYAKLEKQDVNHDGKISGDELRGLKVWVDDGDAKLEQGELKTLAELHITELSVRMDLTANERGETLMRSTFTQDGKQRMTEDVWFGIDRTHSPDGPSNFARELDHTAASLPPSARRDLDERVGSALEQTGPVRDTIRRQIDARDLVDVVEQQHVSILIASLRA